MTLGQLGGKFGFGRSGRSGAWMAPGSVVDLDFSNQRSWPRSFSQELVDSRSSPQFVQNANNSLTSKSAGVLSISDYSLLVEPTDTNLILRSQELENAAWSISAGMTVAANQRTAPDGTLTMDRLTFGTGPYTILQQSPITIPNDTLSRSFSIYFFGGTAGTFIFKLQFNGGITALSTDVTINTATGSAGAPSGTGSLIVKNLGGGMFRAQLSMSNNGTGNNTASCQIAQDYTTAGTIDLWGAQLDQNRSSYIQTTTASTVRSANSITLQRTNIGRVVFTFDDNSKQIVTGINMASQYVIPTNLNRPVIKRMTGYLS